MNLKMDDGEILGLERVGVESSQLKTVGYSGPNEIMAVEFKGGSVYGYGNITADLHAGLMAAESKGKFLGEMIKKFPEQYPFKKVRGTDREEAKKNSSDVKNV